MTVNRMDSVTLTLFHATLVQSNTALKNQLDSEITNRILHALQVVTSSLALPIILIVGLSEAAYRTCTGNAFQSVYVLHDTLASIVLHGLAVIPTSLAGIFTTKKFTDDVKNFSTSFATGISTFSCPCLGSDQPFNDAAEYEQGEISQVENQA